MLFENFALDDPEGLFPATIYLFYKLIFIKLGYISFIAGTTFYCNYWFMYLSLTRKRAY